MDLIKNIEITDTAYGGYGVGRTNGGLVLFVPHTVEGDVIDCAVLQDKKQFAYAKLINLKKPSNLRIKPDCKYADDCGGCLFAHIDYEAQLDIKKRIINNSFRKYKHTLPEIVVHKSSSEGYRIRATVRMRQGDLGFFAFKSNDFIKVSKCRIIKESLFDKMREFASRNPISGELYAIETPDGTSLASIKSDEPKAIDIDGIFEGAICNKRGYGLKSLGFTTKYGVIGVGRDTFFQANVHLLDNFQDRAITLTRSGLSIVELYAGAGFFTCGLMSRSEDISACETSQEAVSLANNYGYEVKNKDAALFLSKIKSCDVIFLDPPRDGVSNEVIENIKRLKPLEIIYVSCSPATLARDVIKLSDNYKIDSYDFFDMFPDTYHIESICLMSRFVK